MTGLFEIVLTKAIVKMVMSKFIKKCTEHAIHI